LDTLVQTKYTIPPAQAKWVTRRHLIEQIDQGAQLPLTLLSAPPGFGKTALLSEWAKPPSGKQLPVAWLSLDRGDNQPLRFARYLAAALEAINIHLDPQTLPEDGQAEISLVEMVSRLVNQTFNVSGDFALVLDDYHCISLEAIHDTLRLLLERLPQQMHLVIATRVDPPLPLALLRARGQLMELRANDLRFTAQEAATFLNQTLALDLPHEAVTHIYECTEGWVTGLQLGALSRRDGQAQDWAMQRFDGANRYVVEYMAEQILDQQPPETRAFLLRTCILERLSAPLCSVLLEENNRRGKVVEPASALAAQRMLEQLEHSNLFLTAMDDERRWYRYHPLFAGFLRQRLQRTDAKLWQALHRRAMDWQRTHGRIPEAVDHALAMGDNLLAVGLVEEIAETIWMSGEMVRLLEWLRALPDELVRSRPRLCILDAWISNIIADYEITQARFLDVENWLEDGRAENGEERDTIAGMLAATQAIVAIMQSDAGQTVDLCQQALQKLPADNWVWRSVALRDLGNAHIIEDDLPAAHAAFSQALELSLKADNLYMSLVLHYEMAELLILQGQLNKAEQTCHLGLALLQKKGNPRLHITGTLYLALCEVHRQWDRLEEARREALEAIQFGRQGKSVGIQVCGHTRLGLIEAALGDSQAARASFERAVGLSPPDRQTSFPSHHEIQARMWERLGRLPEAECYPRAEIKAANEALHLSWARELIAQRRLGEALQVLEIINRRAEQSGKTGRLIESLALQAEARWLQGDSGEALASLGQALLLAEAEGCIRPFADQGPVMGAMLATFSRKSHAIAPEYLDTLQRAIARSGGMNGFLKGQDHTVSAGVGGGLVEALSEREIEILRLIAAGLSNKETAQELVLAQSTVQWHTKNIYRKLNVNNRTQAGRRARELGLLGR
jgi:LuxR family maltose regulon positive regulatory protein